ncbi:GNAT family protein [Ponticaulis sp.]|uniref:GNAT family N-acetyltransferase n=1 Tax=Ponticaulis sp. TaxID=2020902 RepID=UPI000B63D1C4|nr:GNAT family protein [Ponticaulis sp.]MAI89648.1 GNAT family N-acetyltransferase [Ponticaulis sp.]OUY00668.1 MAG: hypothetical protein CBB65_04355 [Hyphomonadaceae bacterium TMED5]|tara:strand:- start:141975 stop:142640 length:666 start_codon:yes stop_codon:yes gene_type:complete
MTDLTDFPPRPLPGEAILSGRLVRLEPWNKDVHGEGMAAILAGPDHAHTWTFMPFDFPDVADFPETFTARSAKQGWASYAILDAATGHPLGMASYMRQRPEHGSLEVGCVAFSAQLKRTAHATEAMYLMAAHIFEDLKYRRYEWKCHNENGASKKAAERLGFQFEGVFRNDMVMKGKNRDTAWFAITDDDWPALKASFQSWLAPENFDENGQQLRRISDFR